MKPMRTGPFPYSPIVRRPKFLWPNKKRVALWVIPNIEFFALNEQIHPDSRIIPDIPAYSLRDYGNRVGIWRVMDVLSDYGIRGTAALNSDLCNMCPEIVEEALKREWDFMGHNESNTRRLNQIPYDNEACVISNTLETICQATGIKPSGWLSSGLQQTWNTLDYLINEGLLYVADWTNDDQPYMMNVSGREIVSIPYSLEINDKLAFEHYHVTATGFTEMIKRQFNVLYREGTDSGRVMAIALHPYIIGMPHRIDALNEALDYICSYEGVWLTTGKEIAEYYIQSVRLT